MLPALQPKESQILQHNEMLLGGQTINLRARQIIYVLAALMDKEDPTGVIRINAKDFLTFVNNNSKDRWSDIYQLTREIFKHLNDNPILLKKARGKDFKEVNWLESLGVIGGYIEAQLSKNVSNYFLYQQGLPYTKLLWDIWEYKSNYTARILDLFQRYHIKESGSTEITFEYDLEELKLFFGVHTKYPRFFDFEKRVLAIACIELEKHDGAPYWFEYEKIKENRAVKTIKFTVHIRHKVLLEKVPEIGRINSSRQNQGSLFDQEGEWELTAEGRKMLAGLRSLKLTEEFCLKIISNMTTSQARAYYDMIKYGVNRSLAFSLVKDHCSFGELIGIENYYVKYALEQTEKARIKRIVEAKNSASKKRITPDDKKGGLAKKVFTDQVYFASFMEGLSKLRDSNQVEIPGPMITKPS